MRMSRQVLPESLRRWVCGGRVDSGDRTRRQAPGSAERWRYRIASRRRVSSLSDHEWWWLARDDRTHVGQRGILRTPVAAVRVDAGQPQRPGGAGVCLEMDGTKTRFVWFGSQGPLGGSSGCADDVVFCAHGIDM